MPLDLTDADFLELGNRGISSAQGDYDRAFQTGMTGFGGALDYLRGNPYPRQSQGALRLAAGFLAPTKSGGWAESFGNAAGNLADQNDVSYRQEMERNMKIADIQRLQAGLYQTKANSTINQMNNALQLPAMAGAAEVARQNYQDLRSPGGGLPEYPTSAAPVDPGQEPPPPPPAGTSNVPMPAPQGAPAPAPAPSPRAMLRVPQDPAAGYAGDGAPDFGRAVPIGPKVYPPGSSNPLPRSVLRPGWPLTPKGPELTPGQYPSAVGLPRTPGAPNYNYQPQNGDPRTPGTAVPGGAIPDSRMAVLDDAGRPVNPAMLAASGSASDANNAPEVTAAQRATPTPPASPAGASATPPAGGGQPAPATQREYDPNTGKMFGYTWAPTQPQVQWAEQVRDALIRRPGLAQTMRGQRAATQAQDILERAQKADIQRRSDAVATEQARHQREEDFYAHGAGKEQLIAREGEAKRTQDDIGAAIQGSRDARSNDSQVDNLEAAYNIALKTGKLPPGKWTGTIATWAGDPAFQFLEAQSVKLRNVKTAGPGSVSNYEQQIIAATTAGPTDSPVAFRNKIAVIRAMNAKDQAYGEFVQAFADAHGSTKGVDRAWGEFKRENDFFHEEKGQIVLDPQNFDKWQAYVYPKVTSEAGYNKIPDGAIYRGPDGKVRKKGGGE